MDDGLWMMGDGNDDDHDDDVDDGNAYNDIDDDIDRSFCDYYDRR